MSDMSLGELTFVGLVVAAAFAIVIAVIVVSFPRNPMNTPAKIQTPTPATIEDVLIRGDLSKLTEAQRTEYYMRVCHSLGLNPLTKPFDYLTLSGKLVLYAKRDAADQLRKINGISIEDRFRKRMTATDLHRPCTGHRQDRAHRRGFRRDRTSKAAAVKLPPTP